MLQPHGGGWEGLALTARDSQPRLPFLGARRTPVAPALLPLTVSQVLFLPAVPGTCAHPLPATDPAGLEGPGENTRGRSWGWPSGVPRPAPCSRPTRHVPRHGCLPQVSNRSVGILVDFCDLKTSLKPDQTHRLSGPDPGTASLQPHPVFRLAPSLPWGHPCS